MKLPKSSQVTIQTYPREITGYLTRNHRKVNKQLTREIALKLAEGALHQLLDLLPLLPGDAGGETETLDATSDTDPKKLPLKKLTLYINTTQPTTHMHSYRTYLTHN